MWYVCVREGKDTVSLPVSLPAPTVLRPHLSQREAVPKQPKRLQY